MLGTSIWLPTKLFIVSLSDAFYKLGSNKTMITSNDKSIVVVDDEPDIVNQIKRFLKSMDGFKVYTFTDPFAALEHFNTDCKGNHIVISDIRMPGMNGYEFVKKTKEIDKKVKVALMSAFEIKDESHNLLPDIKVDAFLQKPFSIGQLYDAIEKISDS
jgi:DNA-binding NtrC family response regulator